MCDTPVIFEPTDTLNGIPISSGGCQALTRLRIGREGKCADCGHPPSLARSQEAGTGILGITKEKQSEWAAFLLWKIFCENGKRGRGIAG